MKNNNQPKAQMHAAKNCACIGAALVAQHRL